MRVLVEDRCWMENSGAKRRYPLVLIKSKTTFRKNCSMALMFADTTNNTRFSEVQAQLSKSGLQHEVGRENNFAHTPSCGFFLA